MSTVSLVVRNALWKKKKVDLLVARGRVASLIPSARKTRIESAQELDASGLLLLPSLTDCHTHLREPGFEYKEDIASGLDAAAHGGFGNVLCMANTNPVNDNATVTERMLDRARAAWPHGPRLYPIGALSRGLKAEELAPMAELADAGCVAFSNDGLPVPRAEFFRRAMEYAWDQGKVVIDHCEEPSMARGAGMNEGAVSGRLGIPAQPDVAEAAQVARDILLADYLKIPIHLAHISCRRSVELIAWAKERGVQVTAETCPHYLTLTEERVEGYDSAAKVNPPLRTRDDVEAMLQALRSGVIDILATDHAPHAVHEKEVEFDLAPCGISGLDTALSVTWGLVEKKLLTLDDLVRAWSEAPCRVFGLPVNRFQAGDPADFLLFDPAAQWEVTPETMRSKGKNTPLLGTRLRGRVAAHFLGGKKVV